MTDRERPIRFNIMKRIPGTLGRAGEIATPHGVIRTPAFLAVGTQAAVKGLTIDQVKAISPEVVLGNAYHLYLEPGHEHVEKAGGLGAYMGWGRPTMTDSGGFQVFSLGAAFGKSVSKIAKEGDAEVHEESVHGALASIDEDGVTFTSHRDGSTHRFTPERSMEIQRAIGADIIVAFDECTSPNAKEEYQRAAMERTHRWAKRCIDAHMAGGTSERQALYAVVQGGKSRELREESARTLGAMDFDGYAIGGSFTKEDLKDAVEWVDTILPENKPRHLLGIGEPEDIFLGVERGIDTFDCVIPTRMGRHGQAFTATGKINLMNAEYREDFTPIDKCGCYACANFTRAYIAHLFRAKESLAGTLLSIHNLHFLVSLVKNIRESIQEARFPEYKQSFLGKYLSGPTK